MILIQRDLDRGDLTKRLEVFKEIFVVPILTKALNEERSLRSVVVDGLQFTIIGQSSAHFTLDLRKPDIFDKFTS
jgi:hypothetical protein